MKEYHNIFKIDSVARPSKLYNIITIYNGSAFDSNDPEMLFGPQRKYIIEVLKKNNHSQKTGNIIKNNLSGQLLRFTKNKNLAGSLWGHFEVQYNHDDIFIITPSLYFLFLLNKFERFQKLEIRQEMKELVESHPCHFDFILRQARDSFTFNEGLVHEMQIFQERSLEDHKDHFTQLNNRLV